MAIVAAFVTLVLSLAVSLMLLLYQWTKSARFLSRFPCPRNLPLLGSALELNTSNEEMTNIAFVQWPKIYGPRYGIQLLTRSYFTSVKGYDVEKLLSSSAYIQKGSEYNLLKNWLGEGLLTSSGAKWLKRRKLLTPAFHFKILEEFMTVFNDQAKLLVQVLCRDSQGGSNDLEICQYITRCTLDVICETAMGKGINAQTVKNSAYVEAVYGINALIQYRAVRPWLFSDSIWNLLPAGRQQKEHLKVLHGFTNSVIAERQKELKTQQKADSADDKKDIYMNSKRRPVAFLDLLLEHQSDNPGELSDQDIREETDTFMFEGHDTTAASLSWTLLLLGTHPECQDKVFEELQSIFGDDKERSVTSQDISVMKYLECCIKESLRLYPSVSYIGRFLKSDLRLDDKIVVPKGFNFSVFIYSVHRDPEVFPEPESFKPERFFPENSIGRNPYAYIPFSAGPRNCIGQKFAMMEEKVILAHLLRNYRIEALDKLEDVVMTTEVILRPRDGIRVRLHPR